MVLLARPVVERAASASSQRAAKPRLGRLASARRAGELFRLHLGARIATDSWKALIAGMPLTRAALRVACDVFDMEKEAQKGRK